MWIASSGLVTVSALGIADRRLLVITPITACRDHKENVD